MSRNSPQNPQMFLLKQAEKRQRLEQFPDFLRIKSVHIFLFGADVDQTLVTPTLTFNAFGVMCAAPEWKLLLFGLKHQRECQEFNCVSALGSLQPACDLTGRVASPVPRGACSLSHPEQNRYALRSPGRRTKQREPSALPLQWVDLIRLVDHNLSSAKAQQRIQSRLFRARLAETTHGS